MTTATAVPGTVVVGYCDAGRWSACFGLSYRDLLLHDVLHSNRIIREGGLELRKMVGAMGVAAGRNEIARLFLDNTNGEWLFFVDTDMGFEPTIVEQLINSAGTDRPVMGALTFAIKRRARALGHGERFGIQPVLYQYVEREDEVGFAPILKYPRNAVMPVAGTGAAALLIHRRVLEAVREAYGDAWFDLTVHPTGDRGKPRTFSEDLSFCLRVQAAGFPVHVDTAIHTVHEKGGIFLDEYAYDHQPPADSIDGGES